MAQKAIEIYKDVYPEVKSKETDILTIIQNEEEKFEKTLEQGLKQFERMKPKYRGTGLTEYMIIGEDFFKLFTTYGFPIELSLEELKKIYQEYNQERGYNITELTKDDENRILQQFHEALKKHQELSRAGAEKKFKGGSGRYW